MSKRLGSITRVPVWIAAAVSLAAAPLGAQVAVPGADSALVGDAQADTPAADTALVGDAHADTAAALTPQGDSARAEPEPAEEPANPDADAKGYPVPSIEGLQRDAAHSTSIDTYTTVPGNETQFDAFTGAGGERIGRFSTWDVVWSFAVVFPESLASSYFLRDPSCSGEFTEKLPPTAQFGPPDCVTAFRPDAALREFTPADPAAVVEHVSLNGFSTFEPSFIMGKFEPGSHREGRELPEGVRHVVLWFRWAGARPGLPLEARWFYECKPLTGDSRSLASPAGADFVAIFNENDLFAPLPSGGYRVELFEDGRRVTAIPFRIGAAPPADPSFGSPDCAAGP